MARLLIVAHAPLASALAEVAAHTYADCAASVRALDVTPEMGPEQVQALALQLLPQAQPGETLILTDVFGATPCNAAQRLADQQYPGPYIDEDAEFECAHPARQQDVGDEGQRGSDDADHENGAGEPMHHHLVGIAKARRDARPQSFQRRAQDGTRSAEACL